MRRNQMLFGGVRRRCREMTKEEALTLLNAGRVEEWNEVRSANPAWTPDLRDEDLEEGLTRCFYVFNTSYPRRGELNWARFTEYSYESRHRLNMRRADLRGTKLPNFAGFDETRLLNEVDPPQFVVNSFRSGSSQCTVKQMTCPDFGEAIYDVRTSGKIDLVKKLGARLVVSTENHAIAAKQELAVFISYAWADGDIVKAIDKWLIERGIRTHIDKRDFFAGSRIREEIVRVMSASNVVVICYSSQAKDRPWTEFERELAADMEMDAKQSGKEPPRIIYLC